MPSIYSYQKYIDAERTVELKLPLGDGHERIGTELATVEGVTYTVIPDGQALPEQPPEIAATVSLVSPSDDLRQQIKLASPHCKLIGQRMQEQIRDLYTLEDELYLARIAIGAQMGSYELEPGEAELISSYQAWVEGVRDWGRAESAKLGL